MVLMKSCICNFKKWTCQTDHGWKPREVKAIVKQYWLRIDLEFDTWRLEKGTENLYIRHDWRQRSSSDVTSLMGMSASGMCLLVL